MLSKQNLILIAALLAASLLLFAVYVGLHSSFHACIDEAGRNYQTEQQQNGAKSVPGIPLFHGYAVCSARVTRRDGDAITALSTAILTIITLGLVLLGLEQSKTTRAQLRPYVLNDSAFLVDGTQFATTFVDRKGQPGGQLRVKNHGQTPAYKVRHFSKIDVALVTEEYRMTAPPSGHDPGEAVLGPEGTMTANRWLDRPLTKNEVEGIQKGTHAIFGYGRVDYVDAWGNQHWSTYRLRYTNSAWPPIGNNTTSMDFCPFGNEAD